MSLEEPLEPQFRIAQMGIGYDADRDMVVLVTQGLQEDDAESAPTARFSATANKFRPRLAEWYGPERAAGIKYAEAFEICEYGRQPGKEEIRQLFPFFGDGASR